MYHIIADYQIGNQSSVFECRQLELAHSLYPGPRHDRLNCGHACAFGRVDDIMKTVGDVIDIYILKSKGPRTTALKDAAGYGAHR